MTGIYVHIPFCKRRCIYCGFYSTVLLDEKSRYVEAVCRELTEYSSLTGDEVSTIYIGGGTPSLLTLDEVRRIREQISRCYRVDEGAEFTMEGNPDDLTAEYLDGLRAIGVNRLSMGVQSFDDARLSFLHRRHTSSQALAAVRNAQTAGFDNISIDLMFGFPGQTLDEWRQDVDTALSLGVQHLSAYSLMYEEGTSLTAMLERGEIEEVADELSLQMYEYLIDAAAAKGYDHYELSNWALPGRQSRHNSSYWQGVPYIGVGAAAHSYDGKDRWSNPENLLSYIKGMESGTLVRDYEHLDPQQRYDEYVMTGLRTNRGVSLCQLRSVFGQKLFDYCMTNAQPHIDAGRMEIVGEQTHQPFLRLTRAGLFVSNDIMSDLMDVET
jgi:oxygen-independent coproporphyrinogen-3 oxidase